MHRVDSSYRTAFMIMSFVQYKTVGLMMMIIIRTRWSTWLESVWNGHFSKYTNTYSHLQHHTRKWTTCSAWIKKVSILWCFISTSLCFPSSLWSQSYEQHQLKWREKRPVAAKSEPDSTRKQTTHDKIRMINMTEATNQQNFAAFGKNWKREKTKAILRR